MQKSKTHQPPSSIKHPQLTQEAELVKCDTILGTSKYHLFDNLNAPLTVWLRNSEISVIHILSLLSITGYLVTVNTKNSQFTLDSQTPFLKLIYIQDGYKVIKD